MGEKDERTLEGRASCERVIQDKFGPRYVLRAGEVAEILAVSQWSVNELVKSGRLRSVKIGLGVGRNHIRIPVGAVIDLMCGEPSKPDDSRK